MTDKEGRISYSDIITLKAGVSPPTTLHMMPNPAKAYTNVYINTQNAGFARIVIINTAGIEVYRQTVSVSAGQNAVRVNIPSTLSRGLYIVQTRSGETTVSNKLVLE